MNKLPKMTAAGFALQFAIIGCSSEKVVTPNIAEKQASYSHYVIYSNNSQFHFTPAIYLTSDVNNDGKSDIIRIYDNNAYVNLSTINFFANFNVWNSQGSMVTTDRSYLTADVNGDGKADLVQINHENGHAYVWLSTGSSFSNFQQWSYQGAMVGGQRTYLCADINGDSKADIVQINHNNSCTCAWLSNDNSFSNFAIWTDSGLCGQDLPYFCSDINGDNKADIVNINLNNSYTTLSAGSSFANSQKLSFDNAMVIGDRTYLNGDVNGDGKSDMIQLNHQSGAAYVWR